MNRKSYNTMSDIFGIYGANVICWCTYNYCRPCSFVTMCAQSLTIFRRNVFNSGTLEAAKKCQIYLESTEQMWSVDVIYIYCRPFSFATMSALSLPIFRAQIHTFLFIRMNIFSPALNWFLRYWVYSLNQFLWYSYF